MANKGKNTNSSQFFFTYKATQHLDRKHTIFGKVESGLNVLTKMEAVPVDGSNRPINKIFIKDIVVFVDPFEEFQKQKQDREKREKDQEELKRQGGTEDDKMTWTGKRVRTNGSIENGDAKENVGKYLQQTTVPDEVEQPEGNVATWEPPKKKIKGGGGFGNFDSW